MSAAKNAIAFIESESRVCPKTLSTTSILRGLSVKALKTKLVQLGGMESNANLSKQELAVAIKEACKPPVAATKSKKRGAEKAGAGNKKKRVKAQEKASKNKAAKDKSSEEGEEEEEEEEKEEEEEEGETPNPNAIWVEYSTDEDEDESSFDKGLFVDTSVFIRRDKQLENNSKDKKANLFLLSLIDTTASELEEGHLFIHWYLNNFVIYIVVSKDREKTCAQILSAKQHIPKMTNEKIDLIALQPTLPVKALSAKAIMFLNTKLKHKIVAEWAMQTPFEVQRPVPAARRQRTEVINLADVNPSLFGGEFAAEILGTSKRSAAKKANLSETAAGELSENPKTLMSQAQLQPPQIQTLMFNLAALDPALFASLCDKYTRVEANNRMTKFWHSEEKTIEVAVDMFIVGNNFVFFEHAMANYCLVVDVMFDLKPLIAKALHNARMRTCDFVTQNGNFGLSDDRSSKVFVVTMKYFMHAVHDAYMQVYAGQHKTKDFIAQLDIIPNTAMYSPFWQQIMQHGWVATATTEKQPGHVGKSADDSDVAAAKKTLKRQKERERKNRKLNSAAALSVNSEFADKGNSGSSEDSGGGARKSTTGTGMCRYFQRGSCRLGDSCRYSHTSTIKKK